MKRFEYTAVKQISNTTIVEVVNQLDLMGAAGWELAGSDYGYWFFKREVESE